MTILWSQSVLILNKIFLFFSAFFVVFLHSGFFQSDRWLSLGLRFSCHNTCTARMRMWFWRGGGIYCWSCHKLGLGFSSAFKEGGEGRLSWSSLSLASSRVPSLASSNLLSFSSSVFSSPCNSSMESRAGLMMLSATWCLRSTYSDLSLSREEERLSALETDKNEEVSGGMKIIWRWRNSSDYKQRETNSCQQD